jgi:hypothetical protein
VAVLGLWYICSYWKALTINYQSTRFVGTRDSGIKKEESDCLLKKPGLMRVIKNIINFLFPEKCLVCKNGCDFICQNCASKIETNVIDKYNTLSIFPFRNKVVNKLLWNLKYYHSHSVAKNLTHAATPHILLDFP